MAVRSTGRLRLREDDVAGYLFMLPALAILGVFLIGPLLYQFYLSLFDYDILAPQNARFIGLANYMEALTRDPIVWRSLKNILIYAAGVVPTQMIIALGLAVLVNSRIRTGKTAFRTIFFLPTVTSVVVVSFIFLFIYSSNGILNYLLQPFGVAARNWMQDPRTALPSIMATAVWSTVGQYFVINLAGLQDIPEHLYEAAAIDGATPWQQFRYITFPLLAPTTFFIATMSTIGTLQVFDQMYLMTGGEGGPANSTMTMVLYIYKNVFGGYFRVGYGSALAVILFLIILVLTLIQRRFFGREVQY
ncbi:MAG: carbohydrate ABC transporter permease [Bacillota bacterium]